MMSALVLWMALGGASGAVTGQDPPVPHDQAAEAPAGDAKQEPAPRKLEPVPQDGGAGQPGAGNPSGAGAAGEPDPLAPDDPDPFKPAPPEGAARDAAGPGEPAAPKKSNEQQIEENYREALKIYGGVFNRESAMDLANVQTRIASNEKLLADYSRKLRDSESSLRSLRTSFDRKVIAARDNQRDSHIPPKVLDQMVADQQRNVVSRQHDLEDEIAFLKQEVARTRERLGELRSRQRLLSFDAEFKQSGKPARPPVKLQDEIVAKFKKLNRFEERPLTMPLEDERGGCDECRADVLRPKVNR